MEAKPGSLMLLDQNGCFPKLPFTPMTCYSSHEPVLRVEIPGLVRARMYACTMLSRSQAPMCALDVHLQHGHGGAVREIVSEIQFCLEFRHSSFFLSAELGALQRITDRLRGGTRTLMEIPGPKLHSQLIETEDAVNGKFAHLSATTRRTFKV